MRAPAGGAIQAGGAGPDADGAHGGATGSKARFALRGAPHAGLACERYVQVSSPIRRFADLVMQQQIARHALHGETLYGDPAQLRAWGKAADLRLAVHAELERRIGDYCKRRYLAQNLGSEWAATVRRPAASAGPGRVWLEDLQLAAEGPLPAHCRAGDTLTVRAAAVDLDRHTVLVEAQ